VRLVSVVIPTHDRAHMLGAAVRSVLEQRDCPWELVVVDDGSTDDTEAVVAGFGDSRIRYLRQERSGVSRARNTGARLTRGDWLAFLDSDDLWMPGKLAAQRAFHERRPELSISQTEETWVRHGVRVNPCRHHEKPTGDVFVASLSRCLVSPSAVILRRDLFEEMGGFDESLLVCEDYDLWLRIDLRYELGLVPRPLVVKRGGHDDQLSRAFWGMDRFRVAALAKLLADPALQGARREAVFGTLTRKCAILERGARRRGRAEEASRYADLVRLCGAAV
jgi:glycosyltransferase involved in cell wall biosynthesis